MTYRRLITVTLSPKANKLFCCDLNCYMNSLSSYHYISLDGPMETVEVSVRKVGVPTEI